MCGIIGGTQKNWDYEAAVQSLEHRGPDSRQVVRNDLFSLAFARLKIIDLSAQAGQPMAALVRQVWMVFNGEIYGYRDLRDELRARGHRFKTRSDTEVLLRSYLEWGDDFIQHVDGMFAFAILDKRTRQLKLYRDRPGIKPLYYYYDGRRFAFSSELKGLCRLCQDVAFNIDHTALYDYLTYHYIPEPKSLYRHVFKLPPAHALFLDLDARRITHIKRYWKLEPDPDPRPPKLKQSCDRLKDLIRQSVARQLVADVPVGFFLSGGMDSSALVAEAARLRDRLQTFTIGFEKQKQSETHYARQVAQAFKTDHHEKMLAAVDAEALLPRLKRWYDEPFGDLSALPTFLVAQYARAKVTVVLTGDGGDELFGGYRWYVKFKSLFGAAPPANVRMGDLAARLKSKCSRRSKLYKWLRRLELSHSDELKCYTMLMGGLTAFEKQPYARGWEIPADYDDYWHFRRYYRPELPLFTRLQYLDFHTYLPGDILTKVDRATMAVALEARVPLLSRALIEFAFALPETVRLTGGRLKGLLKHAYDTVLPRQILQRPKKGFGLPSTYLDRGAARCSKQENLLKTFWPSVASGPEAPTPVRRRVEDDACESP